MLNRKLDIVHLSQFVVVMILVIAVNFFFVRKMLFDKVQQNLELSSHSFYNQNIKEMSQIRSVLDILKVTEFEGGFTNNPMITYSLEYNNLFNYLNIYEFKDSDYQNIFSFVAPDYHETDNDSYAMEQLEASNLHHMFYMEVPDDSLFTSIIYLEKLDSNKVITVNYSYEKLSKFIGTLNNLSSGVAIIFRKSDHKIIYHSDLDNEKYSDLQSDLKHIDGIIKKKQLNLPDSLKNDIMLKNIMLAGHNGPYLLTAIYDPRLDWYYVIGEPYMEIYASLYNYFKQSSIVLFFVILLMTLLVVRTNQNQTKPLKEAVNKLSDNEFVKLNSQNYKNEAILIVHSYDMLKKQIIRYKESYEQAMKIAKQRDQDLLLAKQLQKNILPSRKPSFNIAPNIDIDVYSKALYGVGGDLYDYFLIDKSRILLSIGDVSGKGISSALYMTFVHTLLRAIANPYMTSGEILENLNNKLLDDNISDLFVTMFLGILNFTNGKLEYTNAAHTHPFVIEKSGNIYSLNQNHGIPIGIYKNRTYGLSTIQLSKEDSLFLYTDGLTDANDENGIKYTTSVLKYNLMGTWFLNSEEIVNKIKDSVIDFKGNVGQEDDMTLMSVKYS